MRSLVGKIWTAMSAVALAVCVAGCGSSARPVPPVPVPPAPSSVSSIGGWLSGVDAASPSAAWAVGLSCGAGCVTGSAAEQPLILRWDGTRWAPVTIPSPGPYAILNGVSAGPGASAWAVGHFCMSACTAAHPVYGSLILHWDGSRWLQTASGGGVNADLSGVSTNADGTAWAVGDTCVSCGTASEVDQPLILHWDGTTWSQTATQSFGASVHLVAVSTGSAGTWVAGFSCQSGCNTRSEIARTLILRWDGTRWVQSASPNPGGSALLGGVSNAPEGTAWASGGFCVRACGTNSPVMQPLVLRWDGSSWSQVSVPGLTGAGALTGISAGADGTAWTVGVLCASGCGTGTETDRPITMHWDGARWSQVASPSDGNNGALSAVSVSSDGTAWAAGVMCSSGCGSAQQVVHPMILRWNGSLWVAA